MDYPFLVKTGKSCIRNHGKEIHDQLPEPHPTPQWQRLGAAPIRQDCDAGAEAGQGGPQAAGAERHRFGGPQAAGRAIAYIRRYRATGALMVLDVDRLKPINDAFGHAAGDEVLNAVVGVLQSHVRASDVIGRLGGDEFVLLLWNLTEANVLAKAAQLEAAIDRLSFAFKGRTVSAGASAGTAMLDLDTDAADALEQADRAMYARKKERRGGASASR
jgi:diguanylate cyclase (GGDEF)-like protein